MTTHPFGNPWKKITACPDTPNSSQKPIQTTNFPALTKIINIRKHQKQNNLSIAERKAKIKERIRQNIKTQDELTEIESINFMNNQNYQSNQSNQNENKFKNTLRAKMYSSIEMCKMNTSSYDELKKNIVCKLKIRQNPKKKQNINKTFYINNSPMYMSSPKKRMVNKNFQKAFNSNLKNASIKKQNESKNRSARYMDIPVQEFLQENSIQHKFCKKFEELRKESRNERPKSLTN